MVGALGQLLVGRQVHEEVRAVMFGGAWEGIVESSREMLDHMARLFTSCAPLSVACLKNSVLKKSSSLVCRFKV